MKLVIAYLLVFLALLCTGLVLTALQAFPCEADNLKLPLRCAVLGGVGGCVYCLRGVYLNACVHKNWSADWLPWYYIRPVVSIVCGGVSYLLLRAGLLVLEANRDPATTDLGFYALSFVAGLNVDKFIAKIEEIAQAVWGIEKSRANQPRDQG